MKEMVGGCCVCSDDRGWPENPLVYCDGQSCNVAVHQACYGIVTVPSGPWYCRKCESQDKSVKVKCELCPSRYGALKQTDNSGWAHVVCALYIPEVRFGNVTTMEPIQLQLIPTERFNKVCYICEESGKSANSKIGACMPCNRSGCKQTFHVTCAQSLGLLCEEAGNYLDNVKYCGYCHYHYSKLKKGAGVKTIPPYKPVSAENHQSDSNSEKEVDANSAANQPKLPPTTTSSSSSSSQSSKRKSSSSSKTSSSTSKTASSSGTKSSSSSSQKTVHSSSGKTADKSKVSNSSAKSAKTEDSAPDTNTDSKLEKTPKAKESPEVETAKETKDSKNSKRRKNNSRTPTPVSVPTDSAVTSAPVAPSADLPVSANSNSATEKKESPVVNDSLEKPKKIKTEPNAQSSSESQSAVALTSSTSVVKSTSPLTTVPDTPVTASSTSPTASVIQSSSGQQQLNSLVVSVPLQNTNLSPHSHIINNQTSSTTPNPAPFAHLSQERSLPAADRTTPNSTTMTGVNNTRGNSVINIEMNPGGLKITYEKQPSTPSSVQTEPDRATPVVDQPAKRTSRSQSSEKVEKVTRGKKRNSNGVANNQFNNTSSTTRRNSRSQHASPPPQQQPGAFAAISQNQIKDSPPSSPSSESQQSAPPPPNRRVKGRKSAPASTSVSKDSKDVKLFQNGVHAPHMLGNQLNPNSNMAQKMSDHLHSELEAHSIFSTSDNSSTLVGPQLHHRVISNVRASSAGSTASAGSGLSSMLGGGSGAIPQTLDQLLERQWEQGSQFLMEQAQHFDIASLLSCLHQLRAENLRLEEHVSSLLQRRDHLLAVNARLAIPLTGQPSTTQPSHPHTVNNIHPTVAANHGDMSRSSRHNNNYPPQPQNSSIPPAPVENGLPPTDANSAYQYSSHRSPAASQPQPSPTVRHSPAGTGYPNSGLIRQSADTSGRSAPRSQPYPIYQGSGPSAQSQMVIRRDSEMHQPSTKPS